MEEDIGRALVSFAAAWSFLFALKTQRDEWFVTYTALFSVCVAILVV